MKHQKNILILIFVLLMAAVVFYIPSLNQSDMKINSFEECAEAGFPIMESYPRQCRDAEGNHFVEHINTPVSPEIVDYFYENFINKAIELSGGLLPIEGFTPRMYIDIFPILKEEDFDNVEAIGGTWEYSNGQLKFIPSDTRVITSADGTINKIGMESLLEDLRKRLIIQIESNSDIDNLIFLLSQEPIKHFCTNESRNAESCIEIYQPVCGWNDPEKIVCVKYPCALTYGNSCFACMDENILYYTQGECPE